MSRRTDPPDRSLAAVTTAGLIVGVLALLLSATGALLAPQQFFQSYLVAYIFWIGLALGCAALGMMHHLLGGAWSLLLSRVLESGAATMPLLALLFLPLTFGLADLYPWARPEAVAADPLLQHQRPYLNSTFFLGRAVLYLAVWLLLASLLARWSVRGERTGDPQWEIRLRRLSAAGLVILPLTVTFALIDWVMSLEPEWHSSIYPAMVGIGALFSALAFAVAVVMLLGRRAPVAEALVPRVRADYAGLLIGFSILWAYLAFSQLILIWAANLPHEIEWYLVRSEHGWLWVGLAMAGGQLALPLILLLPRGMRRDARVLLAVAAGIVVAHAVDVFWLIAPVFATAAPAVHWLDLATWAAVGGLWIALFAWRLRHRTVLLP